MWIAVAWFKGENGQWRKFSDRKSDSAFWLNNNSEGLQYLGILRGELSAHKVQEGQCALVQTETFYDGA